ncbi:hypothetical protein ACUXAV_002112 [Cupriavidus metallidurans]|uniref:hypothetical protein n=2 Tax=Burkholderiaceae TaxID=119060 RepID=UPI002381A8F1|nr:hypothetical protein [Cupriavidus metallidurans]MDE4921695.1 hypothetical protein [Cupriavidus metallidurans]
MRSALGLGHGMHVGDRVVGLGRGRFLQERRWSGSRSALRFSGRLRLGTRLLDAIAADDRVMVGNFPTIEQLDAHGPDRLVVDPEHQADLPIGDDERRIGDLHGAIQTPATISGIYPPGDLPMDLTTAVASASTALDLLKTALKIRDQNLMDKAIADMVDQLRNVNMAALEASQEALTGVKEARKADQRITELEAEVRELQTKADERDKYHLVQVGNNSFAYTLKDAPPDGQQRHYLCQTCFDNEGKKAVMQFGGRVNLLCPACKSEIHSAQLQAQSDDDYRRAVARNEQARRESQDSWRI